MLDTKMYVLQKDTKKMSPGGSDGSGIPCSGYSGVTKGMKGYFSVRAFWLLTISIQE